jgi:cob(I)alamin adenosyltransferase
MSGSTSTDLAADLTRAVVLTLDAGFIMTMYFPSIPVSSLVMSGARLCTLAAAEPARRTVAERAERRIVEGITLNLIEKRINRTGDLLLF